MGLLSIAIWLPIALGALLLAVGRDDNAGVVRTTALAGSVVSFLVTIPLATGFKLGTAQMQFVERLPWIDRFNVYYHLGVDGLSVWFVLLTAFITVVVASFRVITARGTVHAALFLVLAFFSASCIWMMLKAEFLAIALVLVYVGAVMVLFLFVVMMLDINSAAFREGFWKHFPLAGFVGALIALEMALVLLQGHRQADAPALSAAAVQMGNTKLLGLEVYTRYLYPLQVAAVLLLVAIVAAIALTLRKRKDSRHMDASEQVKARWQDRVRIIKMPPTLDTPSAAKQEGSAP